ncbi:acrB/AcrD/AcrF family protein, partial [Vibrio harveyi]
STLRWSPFCPSKDQ